MLGYMLTQMIICFLVYRILEHEGIKTYFHQYLMILFIIFLSVRFLHIGFQHISLIIPVFGIIVCDSDRYIIPDPFHILIIMNRLMYLSDPSDICISLLNGLIISLSVWIIALVLEKMSGKESLGRGDIKLLFSLSIYQNAYWNIVSILICSTAALIYMIINRKDMIAFGPFICVGYLMTIYIRNF